MTRHHIFGEMTAETWSMLRMTRIAADFSTVTADGWFVAADIARPLNQSCTESDVRALFDKMIQQQWMIVEGERGTEKRYQLTQAGLGNLDALLAL